METLKLIFIKLAPFFVVAILCLAAGFSLHPWWQQYQIQKTFSSDESAMEALNKIIVLPNELPSIATVTDKEKLTEQPFFQMAENGDKVIIYSQNKRAYLFRPREQKIIDMTVIVTEDPHADSTPTFQTNGQ